MKGCPQEVGLDGKWGGIDPFTQGQGMEEAGLIGYRRLACAVLLRALFDAAHGNGHSADAWQWLGSDQAADLVRLLEMDPAGLARAWGELPRPVAVQLALPLW